MLKKHIFTVLLISVTGFFVPCFAVDQYWDGPNTSGSGPLVGGTGTWDNTTTNWADSLGDNHVAWTSGNDAIFTANSGTVTLGDNITLSSMTFETTGYSINSATFSLNSVAASAVTFTTNSGISASILADLNIDDRLIKEGAGSLTINNTTTIAQACEVNEGTLIVPASSSFTMLSLDLESTLLLTGSMSGSFALIQGGTSSALATVTNGGSLNLSTTLAVGSSGGIDNNQLNITNGGTVSAEIIFIGESSDNNDVFVSGTNSMLSSTLNTYVGFSTDNNTLNISNGGSVDVGEDLYVGFGNPPNTGNFNSLIITGVGSTMDVGDDIYIGYDTNSSNNSMQILDGAVVTSDEGEIATCGVGACDSPSNNEVLVSGTGSTWTIANSLVIGERGSDNSLTISDNGFVSSSDTTIAIDAGSSASLSIGEGGTPGFLSTPTISGGSGTADVFFNHNFSNYIFSPQLIDSVNVTQLGSGETVLTASNTYSGTTLIDQGTLSAGGTDTLSPNSPTTTINNGGTLNLNGFDQTILALSNSGVFEFGGTLTGTTLSVTSYSQSGSGTYVSKINQAGQSDFLTATGTASLAGSLFVDATTGGVSLNSIYHLIHADGGVSGTFSSVGTSFLATSFVTYDPNDVFLSFKQNITSAAQTQNEINVAMQLDGIMDPTPDQLEILNAIVNLSPDQARDALNDLSGEQYTYLIQLDRFNSERLNNRVFNALRSILDPCQCLPCCQSGVVWFQASGGQSFAQKDPNSDGLEAKNWDFSFGVYKTFCDQFLVGAGVDYEIDQVDFCQGGNVNWQTCQGFVYGAYTNRCGYAFADIIFGGSWGDFNRDIEFSTIQRTAKSSPETRQAMGYLEVGLNYNLRAILIQPFIAGEWSYFDQKKISESGAGSVNLEIDSKHLYSNDLYLGSHLGVDWRCLSFALDLAWQHRFKNSSIDITTAFQDFGTDFTIEGNCLGSNAFRGTFNMATNSYKNVIFYAAFSGEVWKNWAAYSVDLGVNIRW